MRDNSLFASQSTTAASRLLLVVALLIAAPAAGAMSEAEYVRRVLETGLDARILEAEAGLARAELVLALFAVASSHSLLAGLGLIHQQATPAEAPANSDSDHALADGKCPISSSRDEIQKSFAEGSFNRSHVVSGFYLSNCAREDLNHEANMF